MPEPTANGAATTPPSYARATSFNPARPIFRHQPAISGEPHESQLVNVAIELVSFAMVRAESECREIVASAERRAATIVQDAHDDVARLTRISRRTAPAPAPAPAERPIRQDEACDPHGEIGNQFFDSEAADDGDPWGFMDDKNELVGVGPALLRRVLRRPAGPRP